MRTRGRHRSGPRNLRGPLLLFRGLLQICQPSDAVVPAELNVSPRRVPCAHPEPIAAMPRDTVTLAVAASPLNEPVVAEPARLNVPLPAGDVPTAPDVKATVELVRGAECIVVLHTTEVESVPDVNVASAEQSFVASVTVAVAFPERTVAPSPVPVHFTKLAFNVTVSVVAVPPVANAGLKVNRPAA